MEEKEKKEALPNNGADTLISIKEAAQRIGTGQDFVSELIKYGLLRALKFKRIKRIPVSVFNKFIEDHLGEDLYEVLEAAKEARSA